MTKALTIAKNSTYLYLRMLVVLATSLYTVRVVLHTLGVVDFGIYGVAGGMVTMFAFLNSTMSSAAQRFLGIEIGKGDDYALGRTFNSVLVIHIVISVALVILGESLGLWLLNHKLDIPSSRLQAANVVLHLSISATVALVLRTPYNALIIARERMWFFSATSLIEAMLKLGIAFAIATTLYDRLEFYAVLVCAVSWLMLAVYIIFCRLQFSESKLVPHAEGRIYRSLVSFISWSFIGSLANVLRTQGVNSVLNIFFGPSLNAAYGVMSQAQNAATQFTGSFQMALSPQIYQSHAQGERGTLHSLIFIGAKLNFILLALLVIPAIYGMSFLLNVWLGTPPAYAETFVKWMLVVLLIETISQPLVTAAAATGNIRNYQVVVAGTVLLNLPLSWLAFRAGYGPVSFLYIALLVQICTFGLRVWFLHGMIDLNFRFFLKIVVVPLLMVTLAGAASLVFMLLVFGEPNNFGDLVVGSSVLLCCAIFFGIFLGLRSDERASIARLVAAKIKRKSYR